MHTCCFFYACTSNLDHDLFNVVKYRQLNVMRKGCRHFYYQINHPSKCWMPSSGWHIILKVHGSDQNPESEMSIHHTASTRATKFREQSWQSWPWAAVLELKKHQVGVKHEGPQQVPAHHHRKGQNEQRIANLPRGRHGVGNHAGHHHLQGTLGVMSSKPGLWHSHSSETHTSIEHQKLFNSNCLARGLDTLCTMPQRAHHHDSKECEQAVHGAVLGEREPQLLEKIRCHHLLRAWRALLHSFKYSIREKAANGKHKGIAESKTPRTLEVMPHCIW